MDIAETLACPPHKLPLSYDESGRSLHCQGGCRIPIVDGVPRFVPIHNYASAFGRQWRKWRTTQLDSHSGTTITRDRLERCLGGFDTVRGRNVVEAGCGAGRFTEVLLDEGAAVLSFDLSDAVVACYQNHGQRDHFTVVQANILDAPVRDESADVVLCLGVIQHTPEPEKTIAELVRMVRPGGLLVIDHYTQSYPDMLALRACRGVLIRLPSRMATPLAVGIARLLLPVHTLFWNKRRGSKRIRRFLSRVSPLADYYVAYPQLGRKRLKEWAILDTHDALTDHYKHKRSAAEVRAILERLPLEAIEVWEGGNGVEARARRTAEGE